MAKCLVAVTDSTTRLTKPLEFFKVFVPNSSSHRMSIPPAFVKYFNGSIPTEAVLRDQSGKSWNVTLKEVNNHVFFINTWKDFVDTHFLEYGDFLVFQFDGTRMFDVKIFSKNGCNKELLLLSAGTNNLFPEVKVKDEPHSQSESDHDHTASLTPCKRNDSEVKSSGTSGTSPKSRRTLTPDLEEHSPSKTEFHISTTKPPSFEHLVRHWSHRAIHLSKVVMAAHNISLKPYVVIIDEMGRSWQVKANPISRGRFALTTGWPVFFRVNSLKVDDICTFEFVLGSDNICGELNVKISRSEEITEHEK